MNMDYYNMGYHNGYRDGFNKAKSEVKHGEWKIKKHKIFGNSYDYVCSVCGCDYALAEYNYCPNCGAKMDGDKHDI